MRRIKYSTLIVIFALATTACTGEKATDSKDASKYEFTLAGEKFLPHDGVVDELPEKIENAAKARSALSGELTDQAHILVQFEQVLTQDGRKAMQQLGIQVISRINGHTWIASTDKTGAQALLDAETVRWADLYPATAKISKDVREMPPATWQTREDDAFAYAVLFHEDVSADEVRGLVNKEIVIRLENFNPNTFWAIHSAVIVMQSGRLDELAAADIVRWVEPAEPPLEYDSVANVQPLSNVDDVQQAPYNLSGSGVTVGVWEVGAVLRATHLDLTPRATVEAGQVATTSDHSMNVAGIIAASGANVAAGEGMAPAANLTSWDTVSDSTEMTSAATATGAPGDPTPIALSNHSYSARIGWNTNGNTFVNNQTLFGRYTVTSQNFDNVVFNTGLIVFNSASNDRDDDWDGATQIDLDGDGTFDPTPPNDCLHSGFAVDADCQKPRGVAKNVITVGAMATGANISALSNFGPTNDGRIKPDLVAHGDPVISLGDDNDTDSSGFRGTSQATPAIAGIAALLEEQATALGLNLSAAAMKALLVQTAQDVTGIGASANGPDYATGWGIGDAQAAADLLRLPAGAGIAQETLTNTGAANAYTHSFYVPAGEAELHVTLAWTDPAGNPALDTGTAAIPATAQLVNDLDLRLIAPDDTVVAPWSLAPANPANAAVRNGGDDTANNVEQVSVLAPAEGVWTARVTAKAGSLVAGPQDFALAGPLTPAAGPIASVKADVVMVMDRSGSMSLPSSTAGLNKLAALQSAATEFLDFMELVGGHQLGLVQFDTSVTPFVPSFDLQPLDSASITNAHTAVSSMTTGNWTNIIDGVTAAETQLTGPAAANPEKIVFLFSDGKHNRPVGTNVADIDTVMSAATRFYAIGFGTDVDSSVMPTVATNHDGLYLEEQTLSAGQLSKLFLIIAGLTVNEDIVIDPDYAIAAGSSVQQSVNLTAADHSVTFATHWDNSNASQMNLSLIGPNEECKIANRDHTGYATRAGDHYRLIRVDLPYRCVGYNTSMHAGTWILVASNRSANTENAKITVLADSAINFDTSIKVDDEIVHISASLDQNGERFIKNLKVFAAISKPILSTKDSEKQDAIGATRRPDDPAVLIPGSGILAAGGSAGLATNIFGLSPDKIMKLPVALSTTLNSETGRRIQEVSTPPNVVTLVDDGTNGDRIAGDGIYSATLKLGASGFYQARLVAQLSTENGVVSRESMASFLIK